MQIDKRVEEQNIEIVRDIMKHHNCNYISVAEKLKQNISLLNWYNSRRRSFLIGTLDDSIVEFYESRDFTFGCQPYKYADWCNLLKTYLQVNCTEQIDKSVCVDEIYCLGRWAIRQIQNIRKLTLAQQKDFIQTGIKTSWFPAVKGDIFYQNQFYNSVEEVISQKHFDVAAILDELHAGIPSEEVLARHQIYLVKGESGDRLSKEDVHKLFSLLQKHVLPVDAKQYLGDFLRLSSSKYKRDILQNKNFHCLQEFTLNNVEAYVQNNLTAWEISQEPKEINGGGIHLVLRSFCLEEDFLWMKIQPIWWEIYFYPYEYLGDSTHSGFYKDEDTYLKLDENETELLVNACSSLNLPVFEKFQRVHRVRQMLLQFDEILETTVNSSKITNLLKQMMKHEDFTWSLTDRHPFYNKDIVCVKELKYTGHVAIELPKCYLAFHLEDTSLFPKFVPLFYIFYMDRMYIFGAINTGSEDFKLYYIGFKDVDMDI